MRGKVNAKLWLCTGGILLTGMAQSAQAQLAVTGNLSTTGVLYESNSPGTGALATQTLNTAFSKNGNSNGNTNGSELDAAYGVVESGYLYLFFAGNLQDNGNIFQIWIADGRTGQNTLNNVPAGTGSMSVMNGSTFSPGFSATYALEMNTTPAGTSGPLYVDQYNLVGTPTATYLGKFTLTGGVGASTDSDSSESAILVGVNNTNTADGVVASGNSTTPATAANQTNAQAISTGFEVGIPLATLGSPTGPIEVMAGINGGSDSGLSNQMLPGLPVGSYDVKTNNAGNPFYVTGGKEFNFSSLTGSAAEYFTVPNAVVPNGNWLPTGGGNWSLGTNWSNGVVPGNVGDTANFTTATGASLITLDVSPTVGTLDFNSTSSYTIAPSSTQTLTLDNGGISATANINDYGGVHYISAPMVFNSNVTVTCENHGDEMNLSGNISGAGGLSVSNSGIYQMTFSATVLSGANSYLGGTTILRGELQLDSANALPTGTALTIDDPNPHGVLDLNGFSTTVGSLSATTGGSVPAQITNNSATPGTSTFIYAGSNSSPSTFPGQFTDSAGTGGGALALTVASGSLTLTANAANNNYTGTTTINNGASLVASFTSLGMAGNSISLPTGGNIANNGGLEISTPAITGVNVSGSGTTTVDSTMPFDANNFSQAGGLVNNGSTEIDGNGVVGTISGGGALTIGNGSTPATLQLAYESGGSSQGSIAITGGSTLDINNNHLIISFAANGFSDPIVAIAADIESGYNGGGWNGPGIISTAAQTLTNGRAYGIGYADGADGVDPNITSGQIEIAYTLLGDANLDGIVNGIDFGILSGNYGQPVTSWDQGDFNYDGVVNGIDFGLLSANYGQAVSGADAVPAGDIAALDAFAAANGLPEPTITSVPEPASAGLLTLAGLGALCRRRVRRHAARATAV